MLRSSLCDYSDAYILAKATLTVRSTAAEDAVNNAANKKVIFKNCVPFTYCIRRINNTQVDDAHDIDAVMSMYNLIEYNDKYSKASRILWQYCRDEPSTNGANDNIANFNANNATTNSFEIEDKVTNIPRSNAIKMLK